MHPLFWLVLCHCVFDYPLQGTFLAQMKAKYTFLLFIHALAWGFGMAATLQFLNLCTTGKIWFLVLGHFAMDYYKCHYLPSLCDKILGDRPWVKDPLCLPLWIDQSFHLLQMWLVVI